jgi:hypothetical protein
VIFSVDTAVVISVDSAVVFSDTLQRADGNDLPMLARLAVRSGHR